MDSIINTGLIGLSLGGQYALLALGFTVVFGILGVVNLAHGSFYVLGGYLAYSTVQYLGFPYIVAVLSATLGCAAIGFLFERFILDRLINDHLATLIITLGLELAIVGGLVLIFGPEAPAFSFPIEGVLRSGGLYFPLESLVVICVCFITIVCIYYLMYRTEFGRALRAMADDREVAISQGMRPKLMFPLAFGLATGLAGLTGAIMTPILSLAPHIGTPVLMTSFLIVILGGLGSIAGATLAAFVVGLVEAYSTVYLSGSKGTLVLFVIVLLMLVFRPSGLMGYRARES